jgi:hypothetical protein
MYLSGETGENDIRDDDEEEGGMELGEDGLEEKGGMYLSGETGENDIRDDDDEIVQGIVNEEGGMDLSAERQEGNTDMVVDEDAVRDSEQRHSEHEGSGAPSLPTVR